MRAAIFFAASVLCVGLWVAAAMMEAQAFNRCTGGNASVVEAMFVQLRVEECE